MLEIVGWLGGIFLAICGVPLAWQSYRDGHSHGISQGFLWLWFAGEALTLIYVLPKLDWPLIFNYGFNILLIFVVLRYRYFPRKP